MDVLDSLYTSLALQSKNKAIASAKSTKDQWKEKKREIRRSDKQELRNVFKTNVSIRGPR